MELTHQPKKIPVYLHIPKNAGTYIEDVLLSYFSRITNEEASISYKDGGGYKLNKSNYFIKRITVETSSCNLTIMVRFLTDYWKTDDHMKHHPIAISRGVNNPRVRACSIETFKTYLRNKQLSLLSVTLEPVGNQDMRHGMFLAHDLIDMIDGEAVNFTILRECFSRQQSLYYYLNGDESSHEPTHGTIKEDTFLQYLSSESLEDSWLIRVLTGIPGSIKLNKHWFRIATDFLDSYNFIIGNITQTDGTLDYVVDRCFAMNIEDSDKERPHYNSTKIKNKITIEDLDEETKQKFLEHTYWDRKLWERYCK
jgi:hypothetical protein